VDEAPELELELEEPEVWAFALRNEAARRRDAAVL